MNKNPHGIEFIALIYNLAAHLHGSRILCNLANLQRLQCLYSI